MTLQATIDLLWHQLGWPLLRLLLFISIGLLVANFIEALNWTRKMALVARPLTRFGHLSATAGAAFSMAFFSGVSANTMLAEAYEQEKIGKRELILANLFNSLPTYFLHLPTTFFITAPLIRGAAFIYIGLTLGAAVVRTLTISLLGRFLLPEQEPAARSGPEEGQEQTLSSAWQRTLVRFRKRIRKIVRYTVPIYILFFLLAQAGLFARLETFMAAHLPFLAWLSPQAISIITLQVAAEFTAGLAAAGALLQDGSMEASQVVLTLLIGNVLSSPVRAIRHQFPYYAGIFRPRLAVQLIAASQSFRTLSIALVAFLYYLGAR